MGASEAGRAEIGSWWQVREAAAAAGVLMAGENALPCFSPGHVDSVALERIVYNTQAWAPPLQVLPSSCSLHDLCCAMVRCHDCRRCLCRRCIVLVARQLREGLAVEDAFNELPCSSCIGKFWVAGVRLRSC